MEHKPVYRLTVELNKEAILRGMRAFSRHYIPDVQFGGDAPRRAHIEDILIAGQVGTPSHLEGIAGEEGARVVRVLVLYIEPQSGLVGIISHDISLELLRELERIGE